MQPLTCLPMSQSQKTAQVKLSPCLQTLRRVLFSTLHTYYVSSSSQTQDSVKWIGCPSMTEMLSLFIIFSLCWAHSICLLNTYLSRFNWHHSYEIKIKISHKVGLSCLICFHTKPLPSWDGSEIGGSRIHLPLHRGETPSQSTEEQSEQPTVPQHLWR